MRPRTAPIPNPCPYCKGESTHRHGWFRRADGTRQARWMCRPCSRTYNENTGTPVHYIKKRDRWGLLCLGMARQFPLRRMARVLRVHLTTAFRWRHRILAGLHHAPEPGLSGTVALGETYVPYSEKGSRRTSGTGAYRCRQVARTPPGQVGHRFRRFRDGRPSCVLIASAESTHITSIIGQGTPSVELLERYLASRLGNAREVWANGLAPFDDACRRFGISTLGHTAQQNTLQPQSPSHTVGRIRLHLHAFLHQFRGVATRYLPHYLAWQRFAWRTARLRSAEAGHSLLLESHRRVPPGSAA